MNEPTDELEAKLEAKLLEVRRDLERATAALAEKDATLNLLWTNAAKARDYVFAQLGEPADNGEPLERWIKVLIAEKDAEIAGLVEERDKYKQVSENERGDWIKRVATQRANATRLELMYLRAHKQLREQHAALTHKRVANRKLREQIIALRKESDESYAKLAEKDAEITRLRELNDAFARELATSILVRKP